MDLLNLPLLSVFAFLVGITFMVIAIISLRSRVAILTEIALTAQEDADMALHAAEVAFGDIETLRRRIYSHRRRPSLPTFYEADGDVARPSSSPFGDDDDG